MLGATALAITGSLFTAISAGSLYAASRHQRLVRERLAPRLTITVGLLALIAGLGCWIASAGGLIGGLITLGIWMTVSTALPYLLARRSW